MDPSSPQPPYGSTHPQPPYMDPPYHPWPPEMDPPSPHPRWPPKARATGKLKQLKGANSIVQAGELLGTLQLEAPGSQGGSQGGAMGHPGREAMVVNLDLGWLIIG